MRDVFVAHSYAIEATIEATNLLPQPFFPAPALVEYAGLGFSSKRLLR